MCAVAVAVAAYGLMPVNEITSQHRLMFVRYLWRLPMRVSWSSSLDIVLALTLCTGLVGASACDQEKTTKPPAGSTPPSGKADRTIPAWAYDARWYQIAVPRFHNGDRSNDPAGTLPWTVKWPPPTSQPGKTGELDALPYGGDLQGIQKRLAYFQELGVNALYLTHVFRGSTQGRYDKVDLRHVDDSLGVKGSLAQITGETDAPGTWRFSASDRAFLDFLTSAHRQGLRVVVEVVIKKHTAVKHLPQIVRRWMDPNGDGKTSDGLDGWALREPGESHPALSRAWREHVRKVDPNAIMIGDLGDNKQSVSRSEFDVLVVHEAGNAIRRFFADSTPTYRLKDFLGDLTGVHSEDGLEEQAPVVLTPLGGPRSGRFLPALSAPANRAAEDARALWQLATVVQHTVSGNPITYYGEEVGMHGGKGPLSRAPMWWRDLPDSNSKATDYRAEFASLVRWLHVRRGMEEPLRRGGIRPVLVDEDRRLFAFARTMPGEDVILVVNYGHAKHTVTLQAGKPGQMIGILSPQFGRFAPGTRSDRQPGQPRGTYIQPLRTGGSRQYVDSGGHIRFWINPKSVRIILVSEPP